MKNSLCVIASVGLAAVLLSGCSSSSSPKTGEFTTDGLIAACLDGVLPIAQSADTRIEGTVSAVAKDGDNVVIIFDARDEDNTAVPAQCTLTVSGDKVTGFEIGAPVSNPGEDIDGAVKNWNDKYAEKWVNGDGPEPVDAPSPDRQ